MLDPVQTGLEYVALVRFPNTIIAKYHYGMFYYIDFSATKLWPDNF